MAIKISGSTIIDDSRNIINASTLTVGSGATISSSGIRINTGIITAQSFVGDGSGLTGVTATGSGVVVQEEGANVGTATTINFVGAGATAVFSNGVATITISGGEGGGGGGSSVGTGITLGTPTDTSFADGLLSFTPPTTVTDAIDEVNEILNKLAPSKPANLSTLTLSLASSYSATQTSTGTVRTIVTNSASPATNTTSNFYDADSGTLTAFIDNVGVGTTALTTATNTGTFGSLNVVSESDPYSGQAGKEGFWKQMTARIVPASSLSVGIHTYNLTHSGTGSTPNLTFYVDDPVATTVTGISTTYPNTTSHYISGVPTVSFGSTFSVNFTVNNAIKSFYNTTRIAEVSASTILSTSATRVLTGTQTPSAAVTVSDLPLTVGSNKYSETNTITITSYNSQGSSGTATHSLRVRVDTLSATNENSRKPSGTGQYPTTGYTSTYDSNADLKTTYTNELQFLNGKFQWPSGTYTNNLPVVGPDYATGMGAGDRWVTFNPQSVTACSSFDLTFTGSSNFGSSALMSGIKIYAKIEGVTGWIDGNAAFSPGTSPSADGAAALVVGNSTATVKRITFGATTRTGQLYIRIGLPASSNKTFNNITISNVS